MKRYKIALHKLRDVDKHLPEAVELVSNLSLLLNNKLTDQENNQENNQQTNQPKHPLIPCSNCDGTVMDNGVCKTCSSNYCTNCGEQSHPEPCSRDNVLTFRLLLLKKPCPNCCARISRSRGCSQMCCTKCATVFNWNSGKVEKGFVHNPHALQMRKEGRVLNQSDDFQDWIKSRLNKEERLINEILNRTGKFKERKFKERKFKERKFKTIEDFVVTYMDKGESEEFLVKLLLKRKKLEVYDERKGKIFNNFVCGYYTYNKILPERVKETMVRVEKLNKEFNFRLNDDVCRLRDFVRYF